MHHMDSLRSFRAARRSTTRVGAAVTCAVEAMECRRLLSAGDPDPTYGGGDGAALAPFPEGLNFNATALDNRNGKTVVAGFLPASGSTFRMGLVRFTESGQPDPTFSGDGRLDTELFADSFGRTAVTDVLIQPDDKILVTGRRRGDN